MRDINRGEQGKSLQRENKGRCERTHEREPIGWPNEEIDKRNRPGKKDKDLEKIRQRATSERVAADREKSGLENEAEGDGRKVETGRPINTPLDRDGRPHHREKKTQG